MQTGFTSDVGFVSGLEVELESLPPLLSLALLSFPGLQT
jgi:hypothetical protein